jgi:hypothetical protein
MIRIGLLDGQSIILLAVLHQGLVHFSPVVDVGLEDERLSARVVLLF